MVGRQVMREQAAALNYAAPPLLAKLAEGPPTSQCTHRLRAIRADQRSCHPIQPRLSIGQTVSRVIAHVRCASEPPDEINAYKACSGRAQISSA